MEQEHHKRKRKESLTQHRPQKQPALLNSWTYKAEGPVMSEDFTATHPGPENTEYVRTIGLSFATLA